MRALHDVRAATLPRGLSACLLAIGVVLLGGGDVSRKSRQAQWLWSRGSMLLAVTAGRWMCTNRSLPVRSARKSKIDSLAAKRAMPSRPTS
jgi:ABC-type nickel/cobalt efflux system permease component RcnA